MGFSALDRVEGTEKGIYSILHWGAGLHFAQSFLGDERKFRGGSISYMYTCPIPSILPPPNIALFYWRTRHGVGVGLCGSGVLL